MQATIETNRLILRPFTEQDAPVVAQLAGEKVISDMTANIPHPYQLTDAVDWIRTHQDLFNTGKGVVYALVLKESNTLIGAVSLPRLAEGEGTLGYWLGVPFWGVGYATEGARALIKYARVNLGLTKLKAMHLIDNERSKSVISKLGTTYIGTKTIQAQGRERKVCVYASRI
ncbi:GNAT family N-acetyltransferase [Vibrio europaeus]|uniref:GNAT family N-acetyltransferase n=1 Tax=Vibrio europaeus TaxID=300876 RepID=UPI00233F4D9C|nr:GNAT family N-acetyltransferase [Vibrio europaeus]MDC5818890.1 GNAT family N-acetyltransferase [Vibrio europaeus]MDC5871086.1 GNAT family N-acetyltransferase [Vibrio europaeus]